MNWSATGAILLAIAVMLGAFGAHGLRGKIDDYSMNVYERAVLYHFLHALGILIVSILPRAGALSESRTNWVAGLLCAGIVLFSGKPLCSGDQRRAYAGRGHAVWRAIVHRRVAAARILASSNRLICGAQYRKSTQPTTPARYLEDQEDRYAAR